MATVKAKNIDTKNLFKKKFTSLILETMVFFANRKGYEIQLKNSIFEVISSKAIIKASIVVTISRIREQSSTEKQ